MATTVASLVKTLLKADLLTLEQAEVLERELQSKYQDPRTLAKELIARGWLTPFQMNQILKGKARELILGQYIIMERLGEGGMGQVFKARHRNLGRIVALKVIRRDKLSNRDAVRRFHREIRAAAQLRHPNVVMAYDADEIDGIHFYVMEYVDGIDLAQMVKRQGPLPIQKACAYIYEAAHGLQHAHERGLVHRDIKPANLLVTKIKRGDEVVETVKILDMGLARAGQGFEDSKTSSLTQDGKVVGTPDYIAPEQARDSRSADIRADLYSLGCTLYYLLAGKVPFPGGSSVMEKLMKHQMEKPVPIEQHRPDVPPGLRAILAKLITKNPEDRFQTPLELANALEPFASGAALRGDSASLSSSIPTIVQSSDSTSSISAIGQRVGLSLAKAGWRAVRLGWTALCWLAVLLVKPGPQKHRQILRLAVAGALGFALLWWMTSGLFDNRGTEPIEADHSTTPTSPISKIFDQWRAEDIPDHKRLPDHPKELVGVIGDPRGRHWAMSTFWGAQRIQPKVVFSQDGRLVASLADDHAVRIWDAESLQELAFVHKRGQQITNFTLLEESKKLAVFFIDGKVEIIGLEKSNLGHSIADYSIPPSSAVVFSEDGNLAAYYPLGIQNGRIREVTLLQVASGRIRKKWDLPESRSFQLMFSRDAKVLVACQMSLAGKGSFYRLDTVTGGANKPVLIPSIGRFNPSFRVSLSPDGRYLAVASNYVDVYDTSSGEVHSVKAVPRPYAFTFSPGGKYLALTTGRQEVVLWDRAKQAVRFRLNLASDFASMLEFSSDDRYLLTTGREAHLWDLATGKKIASPSYRMKAVAFDAKSQYLASVSYDFTVHIWNINQRKEVIDRKEPARSIRFFSFLPKEGSLFIASRQPKELAGGGIVGPSVTASVLDLRDGTERVIEDRTVVFIRYAHDPVHQRIAWLFSSAGKATERTSTIRLFDACERKNIGSFAVASFSSSGDLAFSSDGRLLAAITGADGVGGGKLVVYKVDDQTDLFTLDAPKEAPLHIEFEHNAHYLVSLHSDGRLRVWLVKEAKLKGMPTRVGQTSGVSSFTFRPKTRTIATADAAKPVVALWDITAPDDNPVSLGSRDIIRSLRFSPDGKKLAGFGEDGWLHVWNVDDRKLLHAWRLPGVASHMLFTADGRYLVTGNRNGTLYVFRVAD
ncbi:MAG: hypothetical protein KatS3mg105_1903 [Gemmatales bacterium]|nr:MAG: hypothetical protein KatS3mg105_1903 [Gemmatales bacterium]